MNITMLLSDSAQAVNGKLYILGGGWTDTAINGEGQTPPHALAILVHVPWDQTNRRHRLRVTLLDADGHHVEPVEGQPLEVHNEFEVGRPPGVHPGVSIPFPLAVNLGPLPLAPGRYTWELIVDDDPEVRAEVGFTVRPANQMRLAG